MKPVFTPSILKRISERVANYPEQCPEEFAGYSQVVTRYRAIPVWYSMWALVLITETGEFFDLDMLNESEEPVPIDSVWSQLVTLRLASQYYPELIEALPVRSTDATECPYCQGHGFVATHPVRQRQEPNALCDTRNWPCWPCGTMGWLDSEGPLCEPLPC